MYNIAIIEDDIHFSSELKQNLFKIAQKLGEQFNIFTFVSIEDFLLPRRDGFEIVLFDIELPGMNGMDGAKRFRQTDTDAIIIFITSLSNYAISGYEVDALDYMVKPISYNNLCLKIEKAIKKVGDRKHKRIVLHCKESIIKLQTNEICFIEIRGHALSVHSDYGVYESTGTLSVFEEQLKDCFFSRCNSCYLVNMRAISRIEGMTVYLKSGDELAISRRKKKEFLDDFTKYIGS